MFVLSTALGEISYLGSGCVDQQNSRELIHHFSSSPLSALYTRGLNATFTSSVIEWSINEPNYLWGKPALTPKMHAEGAFSFNLMCSVILLSVKHIYIRC